MAKFAFDKTLTLALAVTLLASMGISLPYPVLTPLFIDAPASPLNQFWGLSGETLLTTLLAIYPLGIFIGSSFIGALSDRYGRKRVLGDTLVICFIGYWVSAYALYIEDYMLLLVSRFLTGISEGNVAIARAIALDLGEKNNDQQAKVRAISLINSAIFVGWLLGPLIGGLLADVQSYYAMSAAAGSSLLCWLMTKYWLPESNQSSSSTSMPLWQSVIRENSLQLIRDKWVRKLFFVYLTYTLAVNLYYEFYPVWLVDKQAYSSLDIGLATTNMTIFMTLASVFLVTRLQARFGLMSPMFVLMLLLALVLFSVPFTASLTTHIAFAMSGILLASFNGLMPVYVSEQQSEQGNGAIMGLLTMTFCIANVFAAVIGGVLLQFDSTVPLFAASFLFVIAALRFKLVFCRDESSVQELGKSPE